MDKSPDDHYRPTTVQILFAKVVVLLHMGVYTHFFAATPIAGSLVVSFLTALKGFLTFQCRLLCPAFRVTEPLLQIRPPHFVNIPSLIIF
ncbi:Uncharacterized protein TCM_000195 [Theobroma cacao]|uniref:Uncharacterized protein n=1 Tax=Theobroma cacao TaxID=3641 RepID=A0A061DLI8_THECC|nr:Uncharacterized protein TCM_000195 [Theobroma cacao]